MKALRFRVQNFRNVDDSGWVSLDVVTAFVGRNESGKTALLKALHRFNPGSPESYNPQRDFPRDRFIRDWVKCHDADELPVCSVEFRLTDELTNGITSLLPDGSDAPETVTVTRHYGGRLSMTFAPKIADHPVASDSLAAEIDALDAKIQRMRPSSGGDRAAFVEKKRQLRQWIRDTTEALKGLPDFSCDDGKEVLADLKQELEQHDDPRVIKATATLRTTVDEVLEVAHAESPIDAIEKMITEHLPVFIYFENYGILDSAIWLDRFLEDRRTDPTNSRVRTTNAMFKVAGLDPEEVEALGHGEATDARQRGRDISDEALAQESAMKEKRTILLNAASTELSTEFSNWWLQRRHEIRFTADSEYFRIWVADDRRPGTGIELESRSKGFQWFFSFYLVFLAESESQHRNAFLLLDEPGLHLHPTAQQELIRFFEKLSRRNQLVYTTHSPFLIDGENLYRIRPVTEDSTGHSRIAAESWPEDRDTIFPLQAAAGYAMLRGLFRHRKNLLVEGITDYQYLHALSQQCARADMPALPDDVYIVPCGGAQNVGSVASLFLAENVRPLILFDGDEIGRARRSALTRNLYSQHRAGVLMLDDVLGRTGEDVDIEDVIGEEGMLLAVSKIVGRTFSLDDQSSSSRLTMRIKESAGRRQIELPVGWKMSAALIVVSSWVEGAVVPGDSVLNAASRLFAAICDGFGAIASAR